ncbi:hypothetical protein [Cellulomonas fimi]|uniref:Uncharacterized protein n=1 Tax=Cellulomonas fimi TaxID=1708 RepID=A0A7Y0M0I6_CELFI|nr:hypothetical protein [Cellulomonas fimi]NMR21520.1 hypothetical protein [Cellulomonas fimi]
MLWFAVWTLLVLATLAGAFLLGRDLWRKGKALLAEVERAMAVVEALAERADQLSAAAERPPITHDLLTDRSVVRARLDRLHEARDVRRALRRLRHERTIRSWDVYAR